VFLTGAFMVVGIACSLAVVALIVLAMPRLRARPEV
jgi:hypothetical protein